MPNTYRLTVATATHKGDRDYQQDRLEVLQHPYDKGCFLVVVADGMGGTSGGAMASGQAIQSAQDLLAQFDVAKDDPSAMLKQLIVDAHMVIRTLKVSSEHDPYSTIAASLFMPDGRCYWVHSGDTRLYHFRRGHMLRCTRDHSFVQGLIDAGEITEQEAIGHPKSNLLVGCLGQKKEPPFDQASLDTLKSGDVIVGCTDGLWAYCNETEIAKVVHALSPAEACAQLLDKARERAAGGGDNVSLVVLKVRRKSDDTNH